MRPDSYPVNITINLPALDDEAAVQIHDFLFDILDLFEAHYGHQIDRFYEDRSYNNLVHSDPHKSTEDPPF